MRAGSLSPLNRLLLTLILVAVALAVLETEPELSRRLYRWFAAMELGLSVLFAAEYAARLWTAAERDPGRPWIASWRFATSPAGIADLAAVAASLAPAIGSGALVLRLVRLGRILRLAKLGRMSRALEHVASAVGSRREELLVSLGAGLSLMLVAATALYLVEGRIQPDQFGSIPRALWWAVATLTTIGYGDVYPVTALGKVLAAITAITSIGLVAMPAGILAAAFSEGMQDHRRAREGEPKK